MLLVSAWMHTRPPLPLHVSFSLRVDRPLFIRVIEQRVDASPVNLSNLDTLGLAAEPLAPNPSISEDNDRVVLPLWTGIIHAIWGHGALSITPEFKHKHFPRTVLYGELCTNRTMILVEGFHDFLHHPSAGSTHDRLHVEKVKLLLLTVSRKIFPGFDIPHQASLIEIRLHKTGLRRRKYTLFSHCLLAVQCHTYNKTMQQACNGGHCVS
mmetsp:Transcript_34368/g.95011  ORF Transcript_34368/g.95011 Transcript_34368/m.95011 type:complete len:210 (+) Transcript_34368:884-1513(+)